LQRYISVRKAADDFRANINGQVSRLEGGAKEDLQRKHVSLLAFDFEAAARLKAWGSFNQIIKVCFRMCVSTAAFDVIYLQDSDIHGDSKLHSILADITLSSEAPVDGQSSPINW